jgi:rhodanese-related sulfurtransferase
MKYILVLFMLISSTACSQKKPEAAYGSISASELKERLKTEKPVLLDVREPDEHAEKNISGSILIPLGSLPDRVGELQPYKEKEIIVYCRSGNRSGKACDFLQKQGFKVVNLSGGMLAW